MAKTAASNKSFNRFTREQRKWCKDSERITGSEPTIDWCTQSSFEQFRRNNLLWFQRWCDDAPRETERLPIPGGGL